MPSAIFGEDEVSIASTIPVQILTTNDNRLGVAMFFHSSSALSDIPTFPDPILTSSPAIRVRLSLFYRFNLVSTLHF